MLSQTYVKTMNMLCGSLSTCFLFVSLSRGSTAGEIKYSAFGNRQSRRIWTPVAIFRNRLVKMVHNRIMKDEKLIIDLSNSLFGREKNSTKYGRDAFRFYHPGSPGRRRAQRPGGVAARAVCLVQLRHATGRGTVAPGSVAR